jgi:hypothetical protein
MLSVFLAKSLSAIQRHRSDYFLLATSKHVRLVHKDTMVNAANTVPWAIVGNRHSAVHSPIVFLVIVIIIRFHAMLKQANVRVNITQQVTIVNVACLDTMVKLIMVHRAIVKNVRALPASPVHKCKPLPNKSCA